MKSTSSAIPPRRFPAHRQCTAQRFSIVGLALLCLVQAGCVQNLMMLGKVLIGDPVQKSALEQKAGINLKKSQKKVLVYCASPPLVTDDYSGLASDVQEELIRRMRRHNVQVVKGDSAAKVLDHRGGTFDPKLLAKEIPDIDYIAHIQLESFSYKESTGSNLYRGRSSGKVIVYEIRGEGDDRHTVQVMDQQFQTSYPHTYPVPMDQTPKNVFIRECVDDIADTLGTSFYSVNHHSLFAN